VSILVPLDANGRGVLVYAWICTALFSVTAILAAIFASTFLRGLAIVVALVLFAAGMIVFLAAYLRAIARSRYEQVSVAGVYLMMGGVAPTPVRRSLFAALMVQTVVALTTASVRPYTTLAFGVLVPLFGLALCGLWSVLYGDFPERRSTDTGEGAAEEGSQPGEPHDEEDDRVGHHDHEERGE
jgi:hypothetical protein